MDRKRTGEGIINHKSKYMITSAEVKKQIKRFMVGLFLVFYMCAFAAPTGGAAGISSGYLTNDPELKPGMMVGLSADNIDGKPVVERARISRANYIIGAAVNLEEELVTAVSRDEPQSFVVATGEAEVYVTDINGPIKMNDQLSISPVRGILMKANKGTRGHATALADFDISRASDIEVTSPDGPQKQKMGKIKVVIHTEVNQSIGATPNFAERVGETIGRKDISEIQVMAAFVIFIMILVIEGGMMYGAVSGAVRSIGRNPLSRNHIFSAMGRSFMVALVILIVGLGVVFGILWL